MMGKEGVEMTTVVNARFGEADKAVLHHAVNDAQLFEDWMNLRAYCFHSSSASADTGIARECPNPSTFF